MSWLTPNPAARTQGLKPPGSVDAEQALTIEKIRDSMLAALADGGSGGEKELRLELRIGHAPDASGLWALRSELMAVLASAQGEARAVRKLQQLTGLFRDVLPQGLASELDHRGTRRSHARTEAPAKFRQQK